jgi:hypothetical protein
VQRHSASTDCARPVCAIRATVRFWFDGDARRVVLDRKISEWGGQGLLCESHADRLIVARGWELDDRRVSEPRLFAVEQADRAAAGRIRRLGHPEAHPSTPLPLDGGPLYALPSDYETPPAAPLTPMPTGTVVPTTGPAAPSQLSEDDHIEPGDRFEDRTNSDRAHRVRDADRGRGAIDSGRGHPSGAGPRNDADSTESSAPQQPKPVSARPKRRSHTDGNTPLLTRAFDAAASRVRPSSTMESLIPRTPPLPEPPHPGGTSPTWPSVRFT